MMHNETFFIRKKLNDVKKYYYRGVTLNLKNRVKVSPPKLMFQINKEMSKLKGKDMEKGRKTY